MARNTKHVWLAIGGIVENIEGKILVVKKNYSGLKGQWSFPAGFVKEGETIDEAVCREIKEETGITASIEGVIAIRSGVINNLISDNMVVFRLIAKNTEIIIQEEELSDAKFLSRDELLQDKDSSMLVKELLTAPQQQLQMYVNYDPGNQFNYTNYHVFR